MANFKPINKNQHQTLKVKADPSYAHSAKSHIVPVSVFELPQVQAEYPIVFIKDAETGQFHLVALLGLKPQENLFSSKSGWAADYVPQTLVNYPFVLSSSPEQPNNFVVGIDVDSPTISDNEGESLFEANGEQTPFLTQVTERLAQGNAQIEATQKFIQTMTDKNLLSSQSLTIKPSNGEEFNVTGLYSINEDVFKDLSDSDFLDLKNTGFLTAIYSCFFSRQRISKLVELLNSK
ncbi:SapC family protein [Colwelliaceae bacterium 6441]